MVSWAGYLGWLEGLSTWAGYLGWLPGLAFVLRLLAFLVMSLKVLPRAQFFIQV
jgi:uncharacterized membrane protein